MPRLLNSGSLGRNVARLSLVPRAPRHEAPSLALPDSASSGASHSLALPLTPTSASPSRRDKCMSMYDFLSAEPVDAISESPTRTRRSSLTPLDASSSINALSNASPSRAIASMDIDPSRRSASTLDVHSSTTPRRISQFLARSPTASGASPLVSPSFLPSPTPLARTPSASRPQSSPSRPNAPLTALEFLNADPYSGSEASSASQKVRANGAIGNGKLREDKPLPRVESRLKVRVMPITDSLVMFGSTQTSANYSISGSVVLTIPPRAVPSHPVRAHSSVEPTLPSKRPQPVPRLSERVITKEHRTPANSTATPKTHTRSFSDTESSPPVSPPYLTPSSSAGTEGLTLSDPMNGARPLSADFSHMIAAFDFGDGGVSLDADTNLEIPNAAAAAVTTSAPVTTLPVSQRALTGPGPELRVTSLKVTFSGYGMYVDSSGRFSAMRLADVSQELLPQGSTLPLSSSASLGRPATALKYDIEFDLSVPGWLPASMVSPFGSTFYCLHAEARYIEGNAASTISSFVGAGRGGLGAFDRFLPGPVNAARAAAGSLQDSPATSGNEAGSSSADEDPSATNSPAPAFTAPSIGPGVPGLRDSSVSRPSPLNLPPLAVPSMPPLRISSASGTTSLASENEAATAADGASRPVRNSWLGKRARQLQFRSRGAGAVSSGPSSPVTSTTEGFQSAAAQNPATPTGATPRRRRGAEQQSADGSSSVRSETIAVIIRRCRDVVPVPVARRAIIGPEGLPAGATQDPPPPTPISSQTPALLPTGPMPSPRTPAGMMAEFPASRPHTPITGAFDNSIDTAHVPAPAGTGTEVPPSTPALPVLGDERRLSATSTMTPARLPSPGPAEMHASAPPSSILPPAPTALNAPSDPAKFAAAMSSPPAPRRGSSTLAGGEIGPSPAPRVRTSGTAGAGASNSRIGSHTAMRHFLHRPVLHPPVDSGIEITDCDSDGGLPFSLTLSLPSHVQVDGPNSDMLSFGVQIEVGRSAGWSKVRNSGGLRLRNMELICLQVERHSSVPSRTFRTSFPLPLEPMIDADDLPILSDPLRGMRNRAHTGEIRLRLGYDRELVKHHISLLDAGKAPDASQNNVERLRTCVVGPPPTAKEATSSANEKDKDNQRDKGKGKERERTSRKSILPEAHAAEGSGSDVNASRAGAGASSSTAAQEAAKKTSRSRRAYESAIRGLSSFANAISEMSIEGDSEMFNQLHPSNTASNYDETRRGGGVITTSGGSGSTGNREDRNGVKAESETQGPRATYSFTGEDGHGVDLTRGRVRMTVNLPLVPSSASTARKHGLPQLVSDFESPYVRIKHKLKVKLGFGFGHKPLGGDGEWGQALVLQVPVRFTDSAPKEVRDQFAPMPISPSPLSATTSATTPSSAQASRSEPGTYAPAPPTIETSAAPVLPAYTQLFREDGSRLADEGEDLPQYPGPPRTHLPHRGSVTAPSPRPDQDLLSVGATRSAEIGPTLGSNRIVPSRIVDEEIEVQEDAAAALAAEREQARELDEMRVAIHAVRRNDSSDEEEARQGGGSRDTEPHRMQAGRLDETVDMDAAPF